MKFPLLKKLFLLLITSAAIVLFDSCGGSNKNTERTTVDSTNIAQKVNSFKTLLLNNTDSAKLKLEEVLAYIDSTKFYKSLPAYYLNKGRYHFALGENDTAITYYNKSIAKAKEFGNKKTEAAAYGNLGNVYYTKGDMPAASEMYVKDMKVLEQINDIAGVGAVVGNLGLVYLEMDDTTKAMECQVRSLKIRDSLHDTIGVAQTLGNISAIYYAEGKFKECLDYSIKGMQLHQSMNNTYGIGIAMSNIGEIFLKINEIDSAIKYTYKAIELRNEVKDQTGLGYSYVNLASLLNTQGKNKEALEYLNKAKAIGEETKDLIIQRNVQNGLYKVNKEIKDFEPALQSYVSYVNLRDSLMNSDRKSEINKQNMQFEYDKKEALNLKELEKQKLIRNGFIIGGILLIAFLVVVYRNYKINKRMNKELNHKNAIIEEKQKEILDSINYAVQIQNALLANHELVNQTIPDSFVLFKPKDLVSGDFYWAAKVEKRLYLAVCDSTGHGVPGAFMSLLNINYLNEAVNEMGIEKPGDIFNHVRKRLIEGISKNGRKDGMDGVLICFDEANNYITYAASNNAPIVVSDGKLSDMPIDKMPIGSGEKTDPFRTFDLPVKKGDTLYLYTDGYADQFGGEKGKKFKYRQLDELIVSVHQKTVEDQKKIFDDTFESWKGNLEQVDDVCIIGIRI